MTTKMLKSIFVKILGKKKTRNNENERWLSLLGIFKFECEQHSAGAVKLLLPSPGLTCCSRRTRSPKGPQTKQREERKPFLLLRLTGASFSSFSKNGCPPIWCGGLLLSLLLFRFFFLVFQTGWSAPPLLSLWPPDSPLISSYFVC
jgi:hypothetical protein